MDWSFVDVVSGPYTQTLTGFNYMVQDLKDFMVSKGFTLIHSGYEHSEAGCSPSGAAGNGGHSFFALQAPAMWNIGAPFLIIQGVITPQNSLGLSIGTATGLPAWPGSGLVTIPGEGVRAKMVWSTTANGSTGYPYCGFDMGLDPADGLSGLTVVMGSQPSGTPAQSSRMADGTAAGTYTYVCATNPGLITYTLNGIDRGHPATGTPLQLAPGTHTIVSTYDGQSVTTTFSITGGQNTDVVVVFLDHGQLAITGLPSPVNLHVTGPQWPAGQDFTDTTGVLSVRTGSYTVIASRSGYASANATYVVTKDCDTVGGTLTLSPASGVLRVASIPTGALVGLQ